MGAQAGSRTEPNGGGSWRRWHYWWPSIIILVIGLCTTYAFWQAELREQSEFRSTRFEVETQTIERAIRDRMAAHEQILRSGAALFAATDSVSRQQWHRYVEQLSLVRGYPGIQGFGYARYVRHSGRNDFVAAQSVASGSAFDIRPAGDRDDYVPVTFLEPASPRNLRAIGFDMMSEPNRRAAIQAAIESGEATMSRALRLVSEAKDSSALGFLVFMPVYDKGMPVTTPAQRQQAIRGLVNSPMRIHDVLRGTLEHPPGWITMSIFDGRPGEQMQMIYQDPSAIATAGGRSGSRAGVGDKGHTLHKTITMAHFGHAWTMTFSSLPGTQPPGQGPDRSVLILLGGSLVSLMAAALVASRGERLRASQGLTSHYHRLADADTLTGLASRSQLQQRLEDALSALGSGPACVALLLLDLDRFTALNMQHGDRVGDLLLQETARRLRAELPESALIARIEGDQFAVLLDPVASEQAADEVAHRIRQVMATPVDVHGADVTLTVSIGITVSSGQDRTGNDMLRYANDVLLRCKQQGSGRQAMFSSAMWAQAQRRRQIEQDLPKAMGTAQLSVHYQPVFDLTLDKVCGAEAVFRWDHPVFGAIPSDEIIGLAEASALIGPLGAWLLEVAAIQAVDWRARFLPQMQVGVQVSAAQFVRGQTDQWLAIAQALHGGGLRPRAVLIEVSDSVLIGSVEEVDERLQCLRGLALEVALTGFGAHRSSLGNLRRLPIDFLKLDPSLMANLLSEGGDVSYCAAIIAMVHRMGLKVVATGVETHRQHELLRQMQCDYAQGPYYAMPLSTTEMSQVLETGSLTVVSQHVVPADTEAGIRRAKGID